MDTRAWASGYGTIHWTSLQKLCGVWQSKLAARPALSRRTWIRLLGMYQSECQQAPPHASLRRRLPLHPQDWWASGIAFICDGKVKYLQTCLVSQKKFACFRSTCPSIGLLHLERWPVCITGKGLELCCRTSQNTSSRWAYSVT